MCIKKKSRHLLYAAIRAFWRQRNERFSIMISAIAHPSLKNFITASLNLEMSAIQASNSNQILFSLLYCITTTKAFDDMPPLCASAAVLALCHFNGALCQFGSYGWHWLYNALCVIFQNCLIFKHQTALKMSTLKHAKKDFCP